MTKDQFYRNLDRWGGKLKDQDLKDLFIASGKVIWARLDLEGLDIVPLVSEDDVEDLTNILSGGHK